MWCCCWLLLSLLANHYFTRVFGIIWSGKVNRKNGRKSAEMKENCKKLNKWLCHSQAAVAGQTTATGLVLDSVYIWCRVTRHQTTGETTYSIREDPSQTIIVKTKQNSEDHLENTLRISFPDTRHLKDPFPVSTPHKWHLVSLFPVAKSPCLF